jgi:hypothetical protein
MQTLPATLWTLTARWAPPPSMFIPFLGMQVHLRDQGLCDSLNRPSRPRRCGRTLRTRWQFARRQCGVGDDLADIGGFRRVLLISSSVPLGFRLVLHVLNRFGRS